MSPNPYTVVTDCNEPYDVNTLLDKLPAYDQSYGTMELLTLSRLINESGNYFWVGAAAPAIPQGAATTIPGNGTINGVIALPAGTYITGLNAFSNQTAGFKAKIWDKGTKASIFYGDYCKDQLVMSPMDISLTSDVPFGPAYLTAPFIITPPGNLNWEIVNLSATDALIQILITCAVPVNNQSIGTVDIQR
jgi:hypothetical protein